MARFGNCYSDTSLLAIFAEQAFPFTQIIDTYTFERVILHDVAITSDQQRMVCVATLTASPDGFRPSVSREEKQIIGMSTCLLVILIYVIYLRLVYNLDKKEIEKSVVLLNFTVLLLTNEIILVKCPFYTMYAISHWQRMATSPSLVTNIRHLPSSGNLSS